MSWASYILTAWLLCTCQFYYLNTAIQLKVLIQSALTQIQLIQYNQACNFKLGQFNENLLSKVAFLNDQNTFLIVKCLRFPFRSVGFGWQLMSKGLNCARFLFKFVSWKIGPLSHLNDFHVFPRDTSVNISLYAQPCLWTLRYNLLYCLASFCI